MSNQNQRVQMVHWYDPRQLIRTGVDVVISSIFGRHADPRLAQALGPVFIYDYSSGKLQRIEMSRYLARLLPFCEALG